MTEETLTPEQITNWRMVLAMDPATRLIAFSLPDEAIVNLRNAMNAHFNGPAVSEPLAPPPPMPEPPKKDPTWLPKLGELFKKEKKR